MNKVYLLALLLILNGLGGMAQPTDYVAYYLFNGNANDESVNANNGVLGDGFTTASFPTLTTDRFGNVDAAYSFDGGDYIDLGTSISLGNAYALALWVKLGAQGTGTIISSGLGLRIDKTVNDVVNFGTFGLTNDIMTGTTVIDDSEWHFIMAIYDGSTKSLYIDGVLEAEEINVTGTPSQAGLALQIGNQAALDNFLIGSIDDIQIYDRALSASEITQIYSAESGLIAQCAFDGDATDKSGNGNNGTENGGVTYTTDRFGNANSAASFDGVDDYVQLPTQSMLGDLNGATVMGWIFMDANPSNANYLFGSPEARLSVTLNAEVSFGVHYASTGNAGLNSIDLVSLNEWNHVAGVYDNGDLRVFINGQLVSETTGQLYAGGITNHGVANEVYIGRYSTVYADAQMDDVRIYDRAFSLSEISEHYTSDTGLVAEYNFDGDATDQSGNGYDGTVIGAVDFAVADRFFNASSAASFSGAEKIETLAITDQPANITFTTWFKYQAGDANATHNMLELEGVGVLALFEDQFQGVLNLGGSFITPTTPVTPDVWHLATLTYDGANLKLYLDGQLAQEIVNPDQINYPVSGSVIRIAQNSSFIYTGLLDDTKIYSRALSSTEISDNYTSGGWPNTDAFITTWQTTAANESITIPTNTNETYDYTVDWGDGVVNSGWTGDATHEYAVPGVYAVAITGNFPAIKFLFRSEGTKLLTIEQWGGIAWSTMEGAFADSGSLTINATDLLDLSLVTDLSTMFKNVNLTGNNLKNWDISNVQNIAAMFFGANISEDLSGWNVSNVTDLSNMFNFTNGSFGDISSWDMSSVTNTTSMLSNNPTFDQDLSSWDISNISNMSFMFDNSGISTANYDNTLNGWSSLEAGETNIPTDVTLGAEGLTYCDGAAARNTLVNNYGWTITGDQVDCPNLVAFYLFDGDATDASVNGNDGTENGGVTLTIDRFGNANSAYNFDGVDDYIVVNDDASLNFSEQITVSAWINVSSIIDDQAIVSKGDIGNIGFLLNVFGTGRGAQAGLVEFGSQSSTLLEGVTRVDDNQLHHIVGTYDGATFKVYIDGVLDNQLSVSVPLSVNAGPLYIGAHETSGPQIVRFTNGSIDDLRIYSRALSASEIASLYSEGGWPNNPIITSIDQSSAAPGDTLTITGERFGAFELDNVVRIGGVVCTVVEVNSDSTQLSFIVPNGVVTDSPITVAKSGFDVVTSPENFILLNFTRPAGLSASLNGTTASLIWDAHPDGAVTSYKIFRDNTPNPTTELFTTAGNSYEDTGLSTGTNYYYRIKALDGSSNASAFSNQASVAVPSTSGTAVSGNLIENDVWTIAGSPYNIVGDVGVPAAFSLTIEPGVVVNFMGDFKILVLGAIRVNGIDENPVTFNGNSSEGANYMLEIRKTDLNNSNINYAIFNGPQWSIQEGIDGDSPENTGTLIVKGSEINGADMKIHPSQTNPDIFPTVSMVDCSISEFEVRTDKFLHPSNEFYYPLQFHDCSLKNIFSIAGLATLISNSSISFARVFSSPRLKIENSIISEMETNNDIKIFSINNSIFYKSWIQSEEIKITNSVLGGTSETKTTILEIADRFSRYTTYEITNSSIIGLSNTSGITSKYIDTSADFGILTSQVDNSTFFQLDKGIDVSNGFVTVNSSNFIDMGTYHIENNTANNITATGNYWNSDSPTIIASKILDATDNLELGTVDISGRLSTHNIDAPISPPQNVTKSDDGAGGLDISWTANGESDVAGYKIYHGSGSSTLFENNFSPGDYRGLPFFFSTQVDAGNVVTINILGLSESDDVAVTAYDTQANGSRDMVEGHESWYAFAPMALSGLLAYYPFNGNANDESGNGNNASVNGGAALTVDRFGNNDSAYNFTGAAEDNITGSDAAFPLGTASRTLTGWVKCSDASNQGHILEYGSTTSSNQKFGIGIRENLSYFWSHNQDLQGFKNIIDGQWHFIAATFDGTNVILYEDGQEVSTGAIPVNTVTNGNFRIGSGGLGNHNGQIDDVRMYAEVLSASEILNLYNEGGWPINTAPVISDQTFSIDENSLVTTVVGTVVASDVAIDNLTFSILSGNTNDAFAIETTTGVLTVFSQSALDFETTPTFSLTVQVSDGLLNSSATITITLNDLVDTNELPEDIALTSTEVDENLVIGTLVGSFSTTDADQADNHIYSLVSGDGGNDNGSFRIEGGQLKTLETFDFETKSSYSIRVQTEDVAGANYQESFTISILDVDESTLIAYYPFNGNLMDESNNSNDGVINGATLTGDRFGNLGNAFNFNGLNQGLDFSNQAYLAPGTGDYTFNAWVKLASDSEDQHVFEINGSSGESVPFIRMMSPNGGNEIRFSLQSGDATTLTEVGYTGLKDDAWHMVTGVRKDQFNVLFYVDGVLAGSTSNSNLGDVDTNVAGYILRVGYSPGFNGIFTKGEVDDIRIYNEALALSSIQALYNEGGWPLTSSETDFLTFSLPNQTGDATINTDTHIITIEVSTVTDITDMISTFTLSEGATVKIGDATQESGVTANDFTSDVTYTIAAENGTTTQNWTVTVAVVADAEMPAISNIVAPSPYLLGSGTAISATVTDNVAVSSVNLFHKKISSLEFSKSEMTLSNNSYSVSLSDDDFGSLGLEYYIEAKDAADNTASTSDNPAFIYLSFGANNQRITGLKAGSKVTDYSIISMPYSTVAISTIFNEIVTSPHDKAKWRLLHFNGTSNSEYPTLSSFEPGKGYWFLNSTNSSIDLGAGSYVQAHPNKLVTIDLIEGQNMIGNPYPFQMDWNAVIAHNIAESIITSDQVGGTLIKYTGGGGTGYTGGFITLDKFEGAFVSSNKAVSSLEIPIPVNAASGGRIRTIKETTLKENIVGSDNWDFDLNLTNGIYKYNVSGLGMHSNATTTHDKFDMTMLPRFSDYIDLSFEEDITRSIVSVEDSYVWKFNVNSTYSKEMNTMTWDKDRLTDSAYGMMLLDVESQRLVDMSDKDSYTFEVLNESKQFELYYGLKSELHDMLNPESNFLGNPYPNPTSKGLNVPLTIADQQTVTRIQIIDLFGKVVYSHESGSFSKGYHQIEINELSLGSGTYIMRVEFHGGDNIELFNKKIFFKK